MPIHPRHLALPLLLALSLGFTALHAQQASSLQQRMSSADFKQAGLDKLSSQQLAYLDQWLKQHEHDKVTTRVVDSSGKPVFYAGDTKRQAIESHIVGHFSGWHGNNTFTLANGQVWQQVGSDQPMCMSADNPSVKVKPSLFGNWLMYVHGCNDNVHVKRIR